jgi:hypothetical protein
LVFTSNDKYFGTKIYNAAVLRKAGGPVYFDYEPDLDGEVKIVKTIYNKIVSQLKTTKKIPETELQKIAEATRKTRENI